MTKFRESLMEYIGEGELIFDDKQIPIKFNCQQLWDGFIIGTFEIKEGVKFDFSYDLFDKSQSLKISGSTNDGYNISIESIYVTNYSIGEYENIKFITYEINVKKREIISNDSQISICFGITNFESFRTVLNTNIGKLIFKNYSGSKDIIKDITAYKKACVTGYALLNLKPEVKLNSIEEYLDLAQKEIKKVLILTSFSQGIYQTWKFAEVHEKIDDKNWEKIYTHNATTRDKCMEFKPVISNLDLTNFLSVIYSNYTDKMEEIAGLQFAIDWYLESLANSIVESQYIMGFVCLELLVDKYEAITDDKILNETVFMMLKDELKSTAKSILKKEGINSHERGSFYSKLSELNRHPFRAQLEKLLIDYKIGYTDIFEKLSDPIKVRDNLVHKGRSDIDFDILVENYNKLMALNQRIILSILNYDGHRYIDWLDNFENNNFNRDPKGEN